MSPAGCTEIYGRCQERAQWPLKGLVSNNILNMPSVTAVQTFCKPVAIGVAVAIAENRADMNMTDARQPGRSVVSGTRMERDEVGVGLANGVEVGLTFLVLAEHPVDAGQAGVATFVFTGGDDQVEPNAPEGLNVRATTQYGVQQIVGDDQWASAVVSLACGRIEAFEGGFADVLAFRFGHRGEEREQHPARAGRVVDPGEPPGEHFLDDAVCGEVIGQRGFELRADPHAAGDLLGEDLFVRNAARGPDQ